MFLGLKDIIYYWVVFPVDYRFLELIQIFWVTYISQKYFPSIAIIVPGYFCPSLKFSEPSSVFLVKVCKEMAPPEHGSVKCSHSNNYGSLCRFSCDHGYELVTDGADEFDRIERYCSDDEQWRGTQPECQSMNYK